MTETAKYVRPSFKQLKAMEELMTPVLTDSPRGWVYAKGWSDERILAAVNAMKLSDKPLSLGAVVNFRKDNFGSLHRTGGFRANNIGTRTKDLQEAVAALETRVAHLESRLASLLRAA